MTRWFALEAADEYFLTSAPLVHRFPMRLAVPPARVWESLASDRSLADWGPAVSSVTWRDERPFGVGTSREVVLAGGLARVRERFFRWDEGRGYAFHVTQASAPLCRRLAENYVLEADGDGTIFTWTIAAEPHPRIALAARALSPVNRLAFGRMASDAKRYFARYP